MPVAAFAPSRLHIDYTEWAAPGIAHSGKVWAWNNTSGKYEPTALNFDPAGTAAAAVAAHVAAGNPHSQYLLESALGTAAYLNVGTSANNVVQLNGSAQLPAVSGALLTNLPAGSAAGSTTQVQYNNAGAFAGDGGMTYNAVTDRLTVAGGLVAPSMRPASDSTTALQLQNAAGTEVLTVDTTNKITSMHSAYAAGAEIARFYTNSYQGLVIRNVNASDMGGGFLGAPALASFNAGDWLVFGSSVLLAVGKTFSISQTTYANGMISTTGSTAIGGFVFRLGADSTYQGPLVLKNGSDIEIARVSVNGELGTGGNAPTAYVDAAASSTARASLRIRSGTAPTTPNAGDIWDDGALVAYNIDATTNAVVNSLKLRRGSSGTPAAGFGLGIGARLESSTTEDQDAGRLIWEWVTATHASRASRGKLSAYSTTTEQEAIRWDGDSGGVKLGFYGVTAVARQTLATGVGATVDNVITALQALGLVKQS